MQKKSLYIIIGCAILLLVLLAGLLFNNNSSKSETAPTVTPATSDSQETNTTTQSKPQSHPTPDNLNPEDATKAFYTWYLSYSGVGALSSGAYKTHPYLTAHYKSMIANFAPFEKSYDPVLCNENKSSNFNVNPATKVSEDKANVVITQAGSSKNLYRFALIKTNGRWFIDDTICIPAGY